MIRKLKKITLGSFIIYFLLGLFSASIVVAFVHLLSISFSPSHVATKGGLHLWPKDFTLKNYQEVFKNNYIWIGYKNTIIITVVGTVVKVKEDRIVIETSADQVRIELAKWGISTNDSNTNAAKEKAAKAAEDKAKAKAAKKAKKNLDDKAE